jgi:hypothetical protein
MSTEVSKVILDALQQRGGAWPEGKGWRTRCPNPSHEDRRPSFFLYPGGGGRCFSLCNCYLNPQELAELLRVSIPTRSRGLTLAELAQAKGLPEDFLRSLGVTDGVSGSGKNRQPCVDIPYANEAGEIVAVHKRLSLEAQPRFIWRRGDHLTLYGLPYLVDIRRAGWVVLVEGETDAWTLWLHRLPSLGLPGSSTWKEAFASPLQGLTVYLWHEPDAGGDGLVKAVSADLPDARIIGAPPEAKDPLELYLQDPDRFQERLETLTRAARPVSEIRAEALSGEARKLLLLAEPVLRDPALLHRLVLATEALGHADDRRNVAALHLAVISRLLRRILSVIVKGPSAAGKSHLVHCVLRVHPESAAHVLSAMSERALAYSAEPLVHRFLVLEEATALEKTFTTYLVRNLLSEGRLRYETVEKTDEGLRARLIEREGPTGLIATTTAHSLDAETETRILSLEVSESQDHLRQALRSIAAMRDSVTSQTVPEEVAAALQWLEIAGDAEVRIPYASWLAERLPVNRVAPRLTRDFGALLTCIEASALLHQRQRSRDEGGHIVATVPDYAIAVAAIGHAFERASNDAVTERQREAVEAVRIICQGAGQQSASVRAVADRMDLHPSNAGRHLRAAAEKGFIVNLNAGEKGKAAAYVPGAPLPEQRSFLPESGELAAAFPALAMDWIDPVTGQLCGCAPPSGGPHDRMGPIDAVSADQPHGSAHEPPQGAGVTARVEPDSGQIGDQGESCGPADEKGGDGTHTDDDCSDVRTVRPAEWLLNDLDNALRRSRHEQTEAAKQAVENLETQLKALGATVLNPLGELADPREPVNQVGVCHDVNTLSGNPNLVAAVSQHCQPRDGEVVGVLSLGCRLGGRVVREAQVIVFQEARRGADGGKAGPHYGDPWDAFLEEAKDAGAG